MEHLIIGVDPHELSATGPPSRETLRCCHSAHPCIGAARRGELHLLPLTDVRHPVPHADPVCGTPRGRNHKLAASLWPSRP